MARGLPHDPRRAPHVSPRPRHLRPQLGDGGNVPARRAERLAARLRSGVHRALHRDRGGCDPSAASGGGGVTDRQKFWLKVVLTVTFPVWFAPFVIIGAFGFCAWRIVSALV